MGQCRVLGASGAVMPLLVKVSYEREVVFVIFSVVGGMVHHGQGEVDAEAAHRSVVDSCIGIGMRGLG